MEDAMVVPSSPIFTISVLIFFVVLAAVVYRVAWLRRVKAEAHLHTDSADPQPGWEP